MPTGYTLANQSTGLGLLKLLATLRRNSNRNLPHGIVFSFFPVFYRHWEKFLACRPQLHRPRHRPKGERLGHLLNLYRHHLVLVRGAPFDSLISPIPEAEPSPAKLALARAIVPWRETSAWRGLQRFFASSLQGLEHPHGARSCHQAGLGHLVAECIDGKPQSSCVGRGLCADAPWL